MICKGFDPKFRFYFQKYNKGRYNNIHDVIDDIKLYIEQNILNKIIVIAFKRNAAILDSHNALEVVTWLNIVQFIVWKESWHIKCHTVSTI